MTRLLIECASGVPSLHRKKGVGTMARAAKLVLVKFLLTALAFESLLVPQIATDAQHDTEPHRYEHVHFHTPNQKRYHNVARRS